MIPHFAIPHFSRSAFSILGWIMDAINVVLFPIESLHYDVFLLFCKNTMNAIVSFMTFDLLTALIAVSIFFYLSVTPLPSLSDSLRCFHWRDCCRIGWGSEMLLEFQDLCVDLQLYENLALFYWCGAEVIKKGRRWHRWDESISSRRSHCAMIHVECCTSSKSFVKGILERVGVKWN